MISLSLPKIWKGRSGRACNPNLAATWPSVPVIFPLQKRPRAVSLTLPSQVRAFHLHRKTTLLVAISTTTSSALHQRRASGGALTVTSTS